jgi:hypothetical protein
MQKGMRTFLYFVCAFQAFMALALFVQWPFAVEAWPFEGTTPLTFIFLSSIFAAAAASTFWAVASKSFGALAGIALDYILILGPVAILAFQLGASGDGKLIAFGVISALGALFGVGLLLWSVRFPIEDTLPIPGLVKWSFIVFVAALLVVSTRLILKVPDTIPWAITPELSVVMGWMFVGAAAYFVYGLLRPSWSAGGLLHVRRQADTSPGSASSTCDVNPPFPGENDPIDPHGRHPENHVD